MSKHATLVEGKVIPLAIHSSFYTRIFSHSMLPEDEVSLGIYFNRIEIEIKKTIMNNKFIFLTFY